MSVVYSRWYADVLTTKLDRPFVHLVFGARQTGKSTLLNTLLPEETVRVDLSDPLERARHLADPGVFLGLCRAMPADRKGQVVFVDEAQSVPAIFDAVQHLYDNDKQRWRFVLCGSSARKLGRAGVNLLPGRSFLHRLSSLTLVEHPPTSKAPSYATSPLPLPWKNRTEERNPFPAWDLETRLAYGALPGIVAADESDRKDLLHAFAAVHLEEEIRREALVRDWSAFLKFLRFAALESGQVLNYTSVSQETGVSIPTVKAHYQLLEDMFVGFRVPVYTGSQRKSLLSTPRFLLFDLGVRHAAAGLSPSVEVVRANPGPLLEQWVGIELWKRLQYLGEGRLSYFRTRDGAEVDFVIEHQGHVTPVEVKWTENPTTGDARHLRTFLREHAGRAQRGFIICRCPNPLEIEGNIVALPWFCL